MDLRLLCWHHHLCQGSLILRYGCSLKPVICTFVVIVALCQGKYDFRQGNVREFWRSLLLWTLLQCLLWLVGCMPELIPDVESVTISLGLPRSGKSPGISNLSGKSEGISLQVREFCNLLSKSGNNQGIRVWSIWMHDFHRLMNDIWTRTKSWIMSSFKYHPPNEFFSKLCFHVLHNVRHKIHVSTILIILKMFSCADLSSNHYVEASIEK